MLKTDAGTDIKHGKASWGIIARRGMMTLLELGLVLKKDAVILLWKKLAPLGKL